MKHVIIVGAGIVGLLCALRLAREGARVTVLESDPDDLDVFRAGASAAAAGMLAPFDAGARPHADLALASFDLWRSLAPGAPWAGDVRFDGAVIACADEQDAAALQARVMMAGRRVSALTRGQTRKRLGIALDYAVCVEDEGVADPIAVLTGLKAQLRALGVKLAYDQDVARVTPASAHTFTGEDYEADHVLLAPGVWATDALMDAAPVLKRVRPAKGHLVSVTLPKKLRHTVHTPGFYLARRNEDTVLGANLQFDVYERHVEPAQVQALLAAAEAVVPGAVKPAGRAWTGIRPMSPDGWPMVGSSNGVLVAAGHSRNGWLLAPITAEIITAIVFGAPLPPAWAALAPQRFEP
jgi:glycine oxidase